MESREEWVERAKTKLDEWNAELDELEAKARAARAERRAQYEIVIERLREYQEEAREKLAEIQSGGEAAWAEAREGLQRSWTALSEGFRAIVEDFSEGTTLSPGPVRARQGKTQLTFVIIAPPNQVDEGDRLFRSHAAWMAATHHRVGETALLAYDVSKAPELSNPMDSASDSTGNTCFILNEVYQSDAGVEDHFQEAEANWDDFPALLAWLEKCQVTGTPAARIFNSLW